MHPNELAMASWLMNHESGWFHFEYRDSTRKKSLTRTWNSTLFFLSTRKFELLDSRLFLDGKKVGRVHPEKSSYSGSSARMDLQMADFMTEQSHLSWCIDFARVLWAGNKMRLKSRIVCSTSIIGSFFESYYCLHRVFFLAYGFNLSIDEWLTIRSKFWSRSSTIRIF